MRSGERARSRTFLDVDGHHRSSKHAQSEVGTQKTGGPPRRRPADASRAAWPRPALSSAHPTRSLPGRARRTTAEIATPSQTRMGTNRKTRQSSSCAAAVPLQPSRPKRCPRSRSRPIGPPAKHVIRKFKSRNQRCQVSRPDFSTQVRACADRTWSLVKRQALHGRRCAMNVSS